MMLPLLLSPDKMAITVTPLKLLQKDHVRLMIWSMNYASKSVAVIRKPRRISRIARIFASSLRL
jgi:hypothetical protein